MPRPDSLSFALNKKTDKLIKTNTQKNLDLIIMIPAGIIAFLLWWHIFNNFDRFFGGWMPDSSIDGAMPLLDRICLTLTLLTTVIFVFFYSLWTRHSEKLKKYKKEIWEILQAEPCFHRTPCNCVDEYCKWIEEELEIDLL